MANVLLRLTISQRTELSAIAKRNAGLCQYLSFRNTYAIHYHTIPRLCHIGYHFERSTIASEIEIGIFTVFINVLKFPFV